MFVNLKKSFIYSQIIILFIFSNLYSAHDYHEALHLTTYFYGAQRCGDTQSWIHAQCHVKDGQSEGRDLTGGWHDCGDHILFGQTAPYSAGALLEGYLLYPSAYADNYSQAYSAPPANGIPDILDEVKIMTDWLIKACDGTRFYYQKGHSADHNHMSEPYDQSVTYNVNEGGEKNGSRNVYSVTSGGSNVAGDAAAALALMAIAYEPYDSSYASQCFNKAKEYFAIGDSSPGTVGGADCCYGAANYQDDMAWGAAAIYRASIERGAAESSYLTKAQNYISGGHGAGSWPLCYDHTELFAHYNLYELTGNTANRDWIRDEIQYYKGMLTTCGIGQYAYATGWGSLRYAANMAFGAILYHKISGDSTAYDFAKKNVDFILGTHGDIAGSPGCPQGRSFVVGYTNPDYSSQGSVRHPHHRAAFGYTAAENADQLWQQENNNPGSVPYKYELTGALVGGPRESCGNYNDKIDDYVANEVGIDYNAGLVGAIAGVIYVSNPPTATQTPTFTLTDTPDPSWTSTHTFTATHTPTETPIPPPTDRLNLEIKNQGSNDSCTNQTFAFNYRIFNWENFDVDAGDVTVRVFLETAGNIDGAIYNARKYNAAGTDQGAITVTIDTNASGAGCTGASKGIIFNIASTSIPANGGYLMFEGALNRDGYQTPFDPECDDYSQIRGAWSDYRNESNHLLYQGDDLVCEYLDPATRDPDTGRNPCTGADGCPGATTFTYTPTNTNTHTFTHTPTHTPTNTHTSTYTSTDTFTNTPTFTHTFTDTPTNTPVDTDTFTPTFTDTHTQTHTNTYTATDTATDTPTETPTDTPTQTDTFTNTYTPTDTPTDTPTNTETDTPTRTPTDTFTETPTDTPTDIPTNTETDTPTETPTDTFTETPTDTLTNTPTETPTNTPTDTSTNTPTETFTNTHTPTETFTSTPTIGVVINSVNPDVLESGTDTAADFDFSVDMDITSFTISLYTEGGSLPGSHTENTAYAAGNVFYTLALDDDAAGIDISSVPGGNYYFVITVEDGMTTGVSGPFDVVIVSAAPTYTYTMTFTETETYTPTDTHTQTFTETPTYTETLTETFTFTHTYTHTPTHTDTPTETPEDTPEDTPTHTETPTDTHTQTPTETPEDTPEDTPTHTETPTDTHTHTPTETPEDTPEDTPTYTETPTHTSTHTFTQTHTPTDTPTNSATATQTHTFTFTNTYTHTPTYTNTFTHTPTHTYTQTYTMTATYTHTHTHTPENTATHTYTYTPTPEPTKEVLEINDVITYPNPYNPDTGTGVTITFDITRTDVDRLSLRIYTTSSRLVRESVFEGTALEYIVNNKKFEYTLGGFDRLANGIYFYVLTADREGETVRSDIGKIVVLR